MFNRFKTHYIANAAVTAAFVFVSSFCGAARGAKDGISDMRCEYLDSPVCIDAQSPRFTWTYSGESGFVQTHFKVSVASSEAALSDPDVWTSGTVSSGVPFIKMNAKADLKSFTEYFWQVTAWGNDPAKAIVSAPAHFTTAMMDRSDWSAVWITDSHDKDFEAAPMFRKEFDAGKDIVSARIFSSACAYSLVSLDGEPVADVFLDPGYTHYDKRNLYTVTDVTSRIRPGANVLTAVLGNGFYNEIKKVATWQFETARWRNRARFILELRIVHKDGSVTVVGTDNSWKTTSDGPYVNNNIYAGDTYDARKEIKGWDAVGFDDSSWKAAAEVKDPSPLLVAQKMPRISVSESLAPVSVKSFGDSVYVFDFGKNISGLCRLSVEGKAGDTVYFSHAELVKKNGRLEPGNINIYYYPLPGYQFQTDVYVCKGGGREVWTPSFSYHGFRYVEVRTSEPMKLDKSSLTALHFHTGLESAGSFECSNPKLNTLWEMTRRTYVNNLMSIPTDCPQREKNGWTADAHLSQEIGILNYDAILFYEKWLDDFIDNQKADGSISGIIPTSDWGYADWIGPVWDAALFIIPYNLYLYYGDKDAVEKIWPVCEKYLVYLKNREDADGLVTYGIGDWLPYDTKTPTEYTTPLFYFYDNSVMAKFAKILGKDASPFEAKALALKSTLNRKYYDASAGLYAGGTQAGQAAALYFGLADGSEAPKVAAGLDSLVRSRDCHLDFGSMGSKVVLRTLTEYGNVDDAFKIATKEDHPSWLAWIADGYTTLGETWIMSPKFNDASLDHIFFGDISAWMVNDIVGIQKDNSRPGFGHFIVAPHFVDGLDWAKASYESVRGPVKVSWAKKGGRVILDVDVPENTSATVKACGKTVELKSGSHSLKFKL